MAAATYYDEPALQQEKPQFSAPSGQQSAGIGNQEHGTQGLGQEMHQQEQRNFPQQGYNEQSNGVYAGQQQPMGNTNHAQGASSQPMNGNANAVNGGQAAAKADDRDTITKCNDNPPDYMTVVHCHYQNKRSSSCRPKSLLLFSSHLGLLIAAVPCKSKVFDLTVLLVSTH